MKCFNCRKELTDTFIEINVDGVIVSVCSESCGTGISPCKKYKRYLELETISQNRQLTELEFKEYLELTKEIIDKGVQ